MKVIRVKGTFVGSSIPSVTIYHGATATPGNEVASNVSTATLKVGIDVEVPEASTSIVVKSLGVCTTEKVVTL